MICLLVMASCAKLFMVLPITDEGRAAWRGFGAAMAAGADADADATDTGPPAGGAQASVDGVANDGTPTELLRAIARERQLLTEQQSALGSERAKIALTRESLDVEIQRLKELKSTVEALLARAESAHLKDVEQLTKLYKQMKPKDAARILTDMDLEVTVHVITGMEERDAAAIMAQLPANRSHAISKILLERAKLPGDQTPVQIKLD